MATIKLNTNIPPGGLKIKTVEVTEVFPYVDCENKHESWESILKRCIVKLPDNTYALQIHYVTPTPPVGNALKLTFNNIANADLLIGGSSADVSVWNTFFGASNMVAPFTSVSVAGNVVSLVGGTGVTFRSTLFTDDANGGAMKDAIVSIEDQISCVVGMECLAGPYTPFTSDDVGSCTGLVTVDFPALTTAGNGCFVNCTGLVSPDFSALTTAGDYCFWGCTGLVSPDFSALTTAGDNCFQGCTNLTSDFPALTTVGNNCFWVCTGLVTINLPSCTALGTTTGNNQVFLYITGKTITLTIPAALMTCDPPGNPDGDIVYLTDPAQGNTVTIIQV